MDEPTKILPSVSAPGKLFWLGEYVVLEGAPAVVCAVDRFARLSFTAGGTGLRVTSTIWEGTYELQSEDGELHADTPEDSQRLVYAVAQRLSDRFGGAAWESGELHIDTAELHKGGKLGLGSSAAVAAGLTVALGGSRIQDREELLALAQKAHHNFQGRVGSGLDVATSMMGGIVLNRPGHPLRRFDALAAPQFLVFSTDEESSTRNMIHAFQQWRQTRPAQSRAPMSIMTDAAARGSFALRTDDEAGWLDAIDRFADAEIDVTRLANTNIVTASMKSFIIAARAFHTSAKPSGAGGGDILVAFPGRHSELNSVRDLARAAGLTEVPIEATDRGAIHSINANHPTQPAMRMDEVPRQ
jgi:phosphomevalonate kinase